MIVLPDANVLIALGWGQHLHHVAANEWFAHAAGSGWATCLLTQSAFLRLSLNAKVVPETIDFDTARRVLAAMTSHTTHEFVEHTPSMIGDEFAPIAKKILGYRQIADATLLHLARFHGMKLATFDASITAICPWPENLEVIKAVI